MPIKQCITPGCQTIVEYECEDELLGKFRKLKTHTGEYFRNVCKVCERDQQRARRKGSIRLKSYEESDYPGGAISLLTGGSVD